MQRLMELVIHRIDKESMHVDEGKVRTASDANPPSKRSKLRSFLRITSY